MLDCLVIGGGPAGLMAAVYLRRFHRSVRVLSLGASRAQKIDRSYNVPGFPDGLSGADLLQRLRQQLMRFDGEVLPQAVSALQRGADGHFLASVDGETFEARSVLLATGVEDVEPAMPGVDALRRGGRLRQCPICDGHEHSGRRIAVLGCGDHGAREALFLHRFSDRITLFDQQPDEPMSDPCQAQLTGAGIARIAVAPSSADIDPAGHVRLHLPDGVMLEVDTVYAALGSRPRSELARGLGADLDGRGNVVTDAHLRSSVPGLYAAGDIVSALDQISVAYGHAAIAATAIHNSLD